MKTLFAVVVFAHGSIHLLGFAKAFGLVRAPVLSEISRPVGLLWLVAGLFFAVAAILALVGARLWWTPALPALLLSQVLIVASWQDAKFGTLANVLVLVALVPTLLDDLPSSYRSIYEKEVGRRLASAEGTNQQLVTSADLAHLPEPVRRYAELSGALGKPQVRNVRAVFRGEIKRSPESGWLPFQSVQTNFVNDPARYFLMDASLFGIPFTAFHRYADATATMQVKVASLFRVVDARGPEMNQSETVTLLNDMCILAPALMIDPKIAWEAIDARSARATFNHAGNTVSAVLSFNERGELVNFVSHDRYLSADGKSFRRLPWSTPLHEYRDFGSARLASRAEASWTMPQGEHVYLRLEITDVEYNVSGER